MFLEDDVALWPCARVLKRLHEAAETIQKKREPWDILCLGRSKKKRYENKIRIGPGVVKPADFWGLFAYVITPTGARKLLTFVGEYQGRLPDLETEGKYKF